MKGKMKNHDVGDVANSLPKKSPGLGQLGAQDAKHQTLSKQLEQLSWVASSRKSCSIFEMRDFMSAQDHEAVLVSIDDVRIVCTRIAELLRSNGFRISNDTVQRCRRKRQEGNCACH